MVGKGIKRPLALFVVIVALGLSPFLGVQPAVAQNQVCLGPDEVGVWERHRPRNKEFSRLELTVDCDTGLILARAFVRCGRTNCTWGYAQALQTDAKLIMEFGTFAAVHKIRAQYAQAAGLNVTINSTYRSSHKEASERTYVLTRAR